MRDRATELLKSASKYGKNVKAIAVTGSVNAMTTGQDIETRVFNSGEWLPVNFPSFLGHSKSLTVMQLTIEDAIQAQHPYISYCVAKAEAEKAIWKYVETEKPSYTVTVLLPALIFGPPIQPVTNLKKINYSNDVFYSLFNGTYETVPPTSFASYVSPLFTSHNSKK
jgi:nucleoside-diphosphate-sugar epimerase